MESRTKLVGHAIHPMLIVFPLGLLTLSVIWDFVYLGTGGAAWSFMAFWCITAGLIGGLLAAIFGFVDWLAIPAETRAKSVGLVHGAGNVVVVGLFIVSWALRVAATHSLGAHVLYTAITPTAAFVLSCAGLALALVTSWLGGELVERLGVAVDRGANLNSPSSLSGRPAADVVSEAPAQPSERRAA